MVQETTTIAKLANKIMQEEARRLWWLLVIHLKLEAIEQLAEWANRLNIPCVKGKEGGDPSSVIFDALEQAKAGGYDVLICDTAGRLQNKVNLMKELEKMNRIIKRVVPEGPQETLLVVDTATGQNGISQAVESLRLQILQVLSLLRWMVLPRVVLFPFY